MTNDYIEVERMATETTLFVALSVPTPISKDGTPAEQVMFPAFGPPARAATPSLQTATPTFTTELQHSTVVSPEGVVADPQSSGPNTDQVSWTGAAVDRIQTTVTPAEDHTAVATTRATRLVDWLFNHLI